MDEPALLAIDSTTERLCVAACCGGRSAVRVGEGGALASTRLLSDVRDVVREIGQALPSLSAVAFGRGPGAFTGLRSACSVAQGLAFGLGCPVLALDSLLVLAEAARAAHDPTCQHWAVVTDARMGEVYAARWIWDGLGWRAAEQAGLWQPEALARAWMDAPISAWTGSGVALLPTAPAGRVRETTDRQRAQALLSLAQTAWSRGEGLPAARALPAYVRDKVAQTTAERQALSARAAMPGA